jgi:hypothetical protein
MGTVMLIFGMGLYELFVSSLDVSSSGDGLIANGTRKMSTRGGSNLFGLFTLRVCVFHQCCDRSLQSMYRKDVGLWPIPGKMGWFYRRLYGMKDPRTLTIGLLCQERPKWLEIGSLSELKIKLGHVIVMILLVGMFEKSKKVPITSGLDLLCFCVCIVFSSASLFLLSKLHSS